MCEPKKELQVLKEECTISSSTLNIVTICDFMPFSYAQGKATVGSFNKAKERM